MKEKFIKSTLILLIGGFITKILGMLIKITIARKIGSLALGMYMIILPTLNLLITTAQFGLPIAISKLISENKRNNKKLIFSTLPIVIIINTILIIIIITLSPIISSKLLHNKDLYLSILSMAFVIPFTTISSICRSYFFGKEKMFPHIISNIVEDIIRLILIIFILPLFSKYNIKYIVALLVLINIISEISSTIVLIFFLPKNIKINKKDIIPDKLYIKDSLKISIPNTTSRLIGSIGYFLEPIILVNILKKVGYSQIYITTQYGILSGYILPILLLPSFFTLAISQALLPIISREYINNNKEYVKKKIIQGITISLIIGLIATIPLITIPKTILKIIYHTKEGYQYLKLLAPICLLQYIQSPLSASLDAMGKSKEVMLSTLYGTIIRITFLIIISLLKVGIYGLIISISLNIIVVTTYQIKKVKQILI